MNKVITTILFLYTACVGIIAQNNDAFYIYRNDGMINTFFRSEIDSITVSKMDADSLFYDNYVTQVIWTEDSIYRIPLALIDSVGFVTPATQYKEGAVELDDNFLQHVTWVDYESNIIAVNIDVENQFLPKAGDKIVTMQTNKIFPKGILGQVNRVNNFGDEYYIHYSAIGYEDVFEYYYGTSEIKAISVQNKRNAKKWAWEGTYRTPSYTWDLSEIISPDIHSEGEFLEWDLDQRFEIRFQATFTGKATIIVTPTMGVVYSIDIEEKRYVNPHYGITGAFSLETAIPILPRLEIPLQIPGVGFYAELGAFFRGKGSASFELSQNILNTTKYHYEASSRKLFLPTLSVPYADHIAERPEMKCIMNGSASIGAYVDLGFEFIDKNFINAGIKMERGLTLEGDVTFEPESIPNSLHSTELYKSLQSSKIKLKDFFNIGVHAKVANHEWSHDIESLDNEHTIWEGSLVPEFSNIVCKRSNSSSPTELKVTGNANGKTLPVSVYFAIQEKTEQAPDSSVLGQGGSSYYGNREVVYSSTFRDIPVSDKEYTISPVVYFMGRHILAEPQIDFSFGIHLCPDNNHPHAIDLGLPCGHKWACCNIGASCPEEYGSYFAWGETHTKSDYSFETFEQKKSTDPNQSIMEAHGWEEWPEGTEWWWNVVTGTDMDAATVLWGSNWITPRRSGQFADAYCSQCYNYLLDYCQRELCTINNKEGILFTGQNGSQIFIPFAGYYDGENYISDKKHAFYHSSFRFFDAPEYGMLYSYLSFWNSGGGEAATWFGMPIRPVTSGVNNSNVKNTKYRTCDDIIPLSTITNKDGEIPVAQ